jgi:hypothetical protein
MNVWYRHVGPRSWPALTESVRLHEQDRGVLGERAAAWLRIQQVNGPMVLERSQRPGQGRLEL